MDVGLVCDGCATFNPMGASECTRCGAGLSLDGSSAGRAPPDPRGSSQSSAVERTCPHCQSPLIPGHKFCGACGTRVDASPAPMPTQEPTPIATRPKAKAPKRTMFFGAMQAAKAKLVLIKGDGLDGVSFTLAGDEHQAGREDCPLLFEEDPFLSPVHANFFYRDGALMVRDESSVNGVYIRIRGNTPIEYGDRFLVGEQLIEVQKVDSSPIAATEDGTYFYASPQREARLRLLQLLRGGDSGLAYWAESQLVSLGREDNDINFPDDPFISGHHARVGFINGQLTLTDLDSKNGTFLRIRNEHTLSHGDYVFMGQQLLRVEIV